MVQWFVCLSVAMATSQGKGYGTQSIETDACLTLLSSRTLILSHAKQIAKPYTMKNIISHASICRPISYPRIQSTQYRNMLSAPETVLLDMFLVTDTMLTPSDNSTRILGGY